VKLNLKKLNPFTEKYSFRRFGSLALLLLFVGLLIAYKDELLAQSEYVLRCHEKYLLYLAPLSLALGFYHAYTGNAEQHSFYPLRFLGPILASPLTCLTYAVVIDSSIALIYIVCYDEKTLQKYGLIDKTTVTFTLLLLITWSVQGIIKIIIDCIKQPGNPEGEIIDTNSNEAGSSEVKTE
jgi:hypothetical protein